MSWGTVMNTKDAIKTALSNFAALSKFAPPAISVPIQALTPGIGTVIGVFLEETEEEPYGKNKKLGDTVTEISKAVTEIHDNIEHIKTQIDSIQTSLSRQMERLKIEGKKSELSIRMTQIGKDISSINVHYDEYMRLLHEDDYADRKIGLEVLAKNLEKMDIPSILENINEEFNRPDSSTQTSMIALYRDILVSTLPFQHNIVGPLEDYIYYMVGIEIKAIILFAEYCTYCSLRPLPQEPSARNDFYTKNFSIVHTSLQKHIDEQLAKVPKMCLFAAKPTPDGRIDIDLSRLPDPALPAYCPEERETESYYAILSNLDGRGLIVRLSTVRREWSTAHRFGGIVHNFWFYEDSARAVSASVLEPTRLKYAPEMAEGDFLDLYVAASGGPRPNRQRHHSADPSVRMG